MSVECMDAGMCVGRCVWEMDIHVYTSMQRPEVDIRSLPPLPLHFILLMQDLALKPRDHQYD